MIPFCASSKEVSFLPKENVRILTGFSYSQYQFSSVAQSHPTLQPARIPCPWYSPGKNTGVSCHVLLQGIFPTQALNLHLVRLLAGRFFTTSATWEAHVLHSVVQNIKKIKKKTKT